MSTSGHPCERVPQMSQDLLRNDINSDDPLLSEPPTGLDPQYELGPDALRRSWKRGSNRRRRLKMGVGLGLVALLLWLAFSLGGALINPALGSSLTSRAAEWARGHGGASAVNWIENEWYSHHPPKVGGKLPAGAIRPAHSIPVPVASGPAHLPPPSPIQPFASPAVVGEGQWSPAGRLVAGIPAIYETTLPARCHLYQLRGGRGVDGHQAFEGDPVLGQPNPWWRPLPAHGPDSTHGGDELGRRVQHGVLDVGRERWVLHRWQDSPPPPIGCGVFCRLQQRQFDCRRMGPRCEHGPQRGLGPPEPGSGGRRRPTGAWPERQRMRRSGVRPWGTRSTSGARESGSRPTVPSSTWAVRA